MANDKSAFTFVRELMHTNLLLKQVLSDQEELTVIVVDMMRKNCKNTILPRASVHLIELGPVNDDRSIFFLFCQDLLYP